MEPEHFEAIPSMATRWLNNWSKARILMEDLGTSPKQVYVDLDYRGVDHVIQVCRSSSEANTNRCSKRTESDSNADNRLNGRSYI